MTLVARIVFTSLVLIGCPLLMLGAACFVGAWLFYLVMEEWRCS